METPRLRRKAVIVVVTLVAGSGLLAYASYRPNLERARARISTGSRIAASRCGPIEYAEAGAGPPVLLVHGAGGGFDQGLEVGEGLARAGFRAREIYGDFTRGPLVDGCPELVVVATV